MFDFLSVLTSAANPKDALTRANFAVQDKLGKFMSLGSQVVALRDKAKADAGLVGQGTSLLNGITTIQQRALTVLGQAKALQDKLGVVSAANVLGLNKALVTEAAGIVKDLYAINSDMDTQTSKVGAYATLVNGLPVGSSGANVLSWPAVGIALGLVGLMAYAGRAK